MTEAERQEEREYLELEYERIELELQQAQKLVLGLEHDLRSVVRGLRKLKT